ncbi:MAG: dihydroneopterin aldolase, partial [Bacteroidaceae bacterium]|nr:dihydroneopterin aldolase [Bacteroidaceae bacterium]
MKTRIHFDQMHFYAFHGVDPQEQLVGNNYSIDLSLDILFEKAMQSDALQDTINYARI